MTMPQTPREVIEHIAKVAHVIGWQAGVGGSETAGAIVSYLAAHPELVDLFFAGEISPVDWGGNWLHEGCLTWHAADGKLWSPDAARAASEKARGGAA